MNSPTRSYSPTRSDEGDDSDWHTPLKAGSTDYEEDPFAATRMHLTDQEIQWALAIKVAIVADPELDNVSDFMYAQWALMCKGNVGQAMNRARQLQWFREEYGITDTVEDCRQIYAAMVKLIPGVFLSLSYNHRDGNYVFVYDLAAVDCKKTYATMEGTRLSLGSTYYMCQALSPDFHAIRTGVVFLVECSGFDWRKNMSLNAFRKVWGELLGVYPKWYAKIKYFNAGVFMNLMNSLKKRFLPKGITDKFDATCHLDGRLSDLYAQPDMEACNQRLMARVEESVKKRYYHEKMFSLDDLIETQEVPEVAEE